MNGEQIEPLPPSLPVMVLPGVTLFPNALLPLYIFEPRYREMLEEALAAGRMVAMAMPCNQDESEVEMIAGAGLVRACIRNDDGTSNLILQGVCRVRFTGWDQSSPYRIARVEELRSDEGEHDDLESKVIQLHALCARFKEQGIELPSQFEAYLNQITSIGVITDLVASTLVADPRMRQMLLEEIEIPKRLEKLLAVLRAQLS
ncbi:MAG: LON peptidase substrate-binding domain-containing protein [Chthoniobacterales bacterium]|nr:LON peptidase substrate-binding domain-containing protein [Chthoniobacterales bacterium]